MSTEWCRGSIYRLYLVLGEPAQVLLSGTLFLSIIGCLAAWFESARVGRRESAMLVLGLWSLYNVLVSRTWLFSILFLILTLWLLELARKGSAWAWAMPVVFALWANLHIQFVVGLGVLGLACLTERDSVARVRLLKITIAAVAATLLNPYGIRVYRVIWEYALESSSGLPIQEVRPLTFRYESAWAVSGLAGWAAFETGRRALSGRRPRLFEALFFVIGNVLAARMIRDVWIGALASLALLAAGEEEPTPSDRTFRSRSLAAALASLVFVTCFLRSGEGSREARVSAVLPVAAARFIAASGLPGPLFNSFEWGTYLIWALPRYPVSVDGRTLQYSREKILGDFATWEGASAWSENRDLQASRLVLANRLNGLTAWLEASPQFERVYQDDHAAVYRRLSRH